MRYKPLFVYSLWLVVAFAAWLRLLTPAIPELDAPQPAPQSGVTTETPAARVTVPEQQATTESVRSANEAHAAYPPETDISASPYPLSHHDIAELKPGDRLRLPHPEGGTISLSVKRVRAHGASRTLALSNGHLPSTLTLGPDSFFGTIATSRGVYALSSSVENSVLIDQRLLQQRTQTHANDYRAPHRTPSG